MVTIIGGDKFSDTRFNNSPQTQADFISTPRFFFPAKKIILSEEGLGLRLGINLAI